MLSSAPIFQTAKKCRQEAYPLAHVKKENNGLLIMNNCQCQRHCMRTRVEVSVRMFAQGEWDNSGKAWLLSAALGREFWQMSGPELVILVLSTCN